MPVEHDPDCCLHPESQCAKAGGCSSACNCGAGGGGECHPVTLPSGETISVLGRGEMSPQGVAALGELVEVVRARMAAEHPADPAAEALWARVDARAFLLRVSVRDAAKLVGVKPSVFTRLANGRMPEADDLARVEAWLAREGPSPLGSAAPDANRTGGPLTPGGPSD